MRSRHAAMASIVLLALAGLNGCGSNGGDAKPKPKLRVVATTPQAADFVRAVGGSRVEVDQLIPNREDPHGYAPPGGLGRMLKDADLVIRSGGDLDAWLPGAATRAGVDDIDLVDLSKAVVLRQRDGRVDFHWWQDPRNAAAATLKIRDELIKRDADGSRPYRGAASRYRRKLDVLDRAAAHCLSRVPAGARGLFTTHDAFEYLAARYRLRVAGSVMLRPPPPSAASAPIDVAELARSIRRSDVLAVFGEHGASVGSKLADAAREAGVPVAGTLYADTLGSPGSADARYLSAFAHDARTIGIGLGAPAGECSLGG